MPGENDYRHNHYVPEWYQRRFMLPGQRKFWYLDTRPETKTQGSATWTRRHLLHWGPALCFAQDDLYTTHWGGVEDREIERSFFGAIDENGKAAVEYFSDFAHPSAHDRHVRHLLRYMSTQKLRTPKGLGWLRDQMRAPDPNVTLLTLTEFRDIFGAIWCECIWQIADASQSPTKFLISDHPVTVYNRECPPGSKICEGHSDPDIRLVATQTLFPLSLEKILILTNLSWVRDPYQSPHTLRPNPNLLRPSVFNYQDIQTHRMLSESEVIELNFITKRRAFRYLAAAQIDWLYPERNLQSDHWRKFGDGYLLMPDPRHVHMGGEMFFGGDGWAEGFGPYGHRPNQPGYADQARERRETENLERFKAEWSSMFGRSYRGITGMNVRGGRLITENSEELHQDWLATDSAWRQRPGERSRRRRLRRE